MHFMVEIGEYDNIDVAKQAGAGQVRLRFEKVLEHPKTLYQCLLMRRVCDHIASMTDRYAIEEYNSLY